MKRVMLLVGVLTILLLDFAALDDITTGTQAFYTTEYSILASSAVLFASLLFIWKKIPGKDQYKYILPSILLTGTVFAFVTIFQEFLIFHKQYGTIFRIRDCILPNPVTTACFYGAFAFLAAFIYSLRILKKKGNDKQKHHKYLQLFLIGGNIFAWVNTAIIIYKFYFPSDKIGCGGQLITNPYTTPCFIGASIFLLVLIASQLNWKKHFSK